MLITAKDLKNLGFKESRALGLALELAEKEASSLDPEGMVALLKQLLGNPSAFAQEEKLKPLVSELLKKCKFIPLAPAKSYTIFGREAIEQGALDQMEVAMRLPVAVAGALTPDAHGNPVFLSGFRIQVKPCKVFGFRGKFAGIHCDFCIVPGNVCPQTTGPGM
jgi:tRNA-splicing ligase RtcB